MKRVFEGKTRLQEIGMVDGIRAINVRVGDRRVFNGGAQEEVTRVEVSKTGKTVKITCKWFDKMSKYENGQWVGEWKEDTRNMRADTIVVVAELNAAEEIEVVEDVQTIDPYKEVKSIIEEIQNDIYSTNPITIDFVYSHNCIQIIFDGYNWSSYAVTIEEFNIIKNYFECSMYGVHENIEEEEEEEEIIIEDEMLKVEDIINFDDEKIISFLNDLEYKYMINIFSYKKKFCNEYIEEAENSGGTYFASPGMYLNNIRLLNKFIEMKSLEYMEG